MILTKIKNKIINKFIVKNWNFLVKSISFYLILVSSSLYGMEVEENQALKETPPEILKIIFNHLDEGRMDPYDLFTPAEIKVCPIPIKDFIAAAMVCKRWREANLSMRGDRILSISAKKIISEKGDYEAIRDSGYTTLCLFSESLVPEDVSYLNYLAHVTSLTLLPPERSRAYTHPFSKPLRSEKKYLQPNVMENIGRLKNLTSLHLAGNNLDSEVQYLRHLTKLDMLDLTCNNPTTEDLLSLAYLENLKFLKLLAVKNDNPRRFDLHFGQKLPKCTIMVFG